MNCYIPAETEPCKCVLMFTPKKGGRGNVVAILKGGGGGRITKGFGLVLTQELKVLAICNSGC